MQLILPLIDEVEAHENGPSILSYATSSLRHQTYPADH